MAAMKKYESELLMSRITPELLSKLRLALQGRLSFDGKAPFPKDCMLSVYGTGQRKEFEVWDWRKT